MDGGSYDIVVIGGGIVGCAVLRECTMRFKNKACVLLEKNKEVLEGSSSGNAGIFHTGFDATPSTLEAKCIKIGWKRFQTLQNITKLRYKKCGAILVAWNEDELARLDSIIEIALENGVEDVRMLTRDEIVKLEPNISNHVKGGILIPGEGVVDPWLLPMFYLHDAISNGAKLIRSCLVEDGQFKCEKGERGYWVLNTSKGVIKTRIVINCAGNYGDILESIPIFQSSKKETPFKIFPRKGQFVVFDNAAHHLIHPESKLQRKTISSDGLINHIILPVPTQRTKGVIVFRSIFDFLIVGPTAEDQEDREKTITSRETIWNLAKEGERIIPTLTSKKILGTYAGIRPATQFKDYQIYSHKSLNWITVGGIRSTGLSASLGIADYVVEMMREELGNELKECRYEESEMIEKWKSLASQLMDAQKRVDISGENVEVKINGYTHSVSHKMNQIIERVLISKL